MFKQKISKEELNEMPVVAFAGKITLVDSPEKADKAIEEIRNAGMVGVDTETKPSFTRGTYHKVSLVQISTTEHCYLFRLNKMPFPPALYSISILKFVPSFFNFISILTYSEAHSKWDMPTGGLVGSVWRGIVDQSPVLINLNFSFQTEE
jgi:hypothetical protein